MAYLLDIGKKGMTGSKLGIPEPRRRTSHAEPDYSTF
jgi:hypothetical protein